MTHGKQAMNYKEAVLSIEPRSEVLPPCSTSDGYTVGVREGSGWYSLNFPSGLKSSPTELEAWVAAYSYLKSK
jgi:hypothetical protein